MLIIDIQFALQQSIRLTQALAGSCDSIIRLFAFCQFAESGLCGSFYHNLLLLVG